MSSWPILSLDLATKTGWALRDRDGRVFSGVQEFPLKRGESRGIRFLRFRKWLQGCLEKGKLGRRFSDNSPGVIVYEQAHHRGGYATEVCVGLVTDVLAEAAREGIEHMSVHSATLKKATTGSGRSSKKDMIAQVQLWYPDLNIIDDNHADALCLLHYGLNELGKV